MKKAVLAITLGFILSISVVACKKKEEQPIPKTPSQAPAQPQQQTPIETPMSPMKSPHSVVPKTEKKIVVPEIVKGWSKVNLVFEDKASKKVSEYMVTINSEFNIPNTKLKVAVGEFLPHFTMDGSVITSVSNEPKNPAVRVEIFEKGKSIFKGWLYSRHPAVHPFNHEKYGLTLKEGIKG